MPAGLDICRRCLAVNRVPEHVEHTRENSLANRRHQWPTCVFHCPAASEALRGRQRHPAHAMRVELS